MPLHRVSGLAKQAIRAVQMNLHDDYDVVECFWRIKQGSNKGVLENWRQRLEKEITYLNDRCKALGYQMKMGEDVERNATLLESLQEERNKAKQKLARVKEQAEQEVQDHQAALRELEDILCLPQVVAVRVETPVVIAFTVVATTEYKGLIYHLDTWDIFFGNVGRARHLNKGSGDRDAYRVKRVVSGLTRDVSVTEFHNWTDGSFCFGTNYDRVNAYAKSRDFLHGMQAMILYLSTVRAMRRQEIPKTFKVFKKEGGS